MKTRFLAAILPTLAVAVPSWAGFVAQLPRTNAPLLDEGGLVMLALALAGTGLTLLRGRKR